MTTTAATTSASSSTSNDSPIQENNVAAEPNVEQLLQQQPQSQPPTPQQQQSSTTASTNKPKQTNIEQKRPMNAFLLFCKRQRSLVREKYPNLENRGITKILGDRWSKLDKEQKSKYTDLARQHKEAFMKANPDFKWCKTPISTSNNNNNSHNSTTISNDCFTSTSNRNTGSSPSPANHNNIDTTAANTHVANATSTSNASALAPTTTATRLAITTSLTATAASGFQQTNFRDTMTNNRQHEAPKPPKKRFLERNDSRHTRSNFSDNEPSPNTRKTVVPHISIEQETLDRVIEEAFSEKSTSSPPGLNMCKSSNRISANPVSPLGVNSTSFTTSTITMTKSTSSTSSSSSSTSSSYSNYADEPVDFSMNRTFNATGQQIINNLVEKMLSKPESASSSSRLNGTDSIHHLPGLSLKRENPEDT